jgi:hypothetical protein
MVLYKAYDISTCLHNTHWDHACHTSNVVQEPSPMIFGITWLWIPPALVCTVERRQIDTEICFKT